MAVRIRAAALVASLLAALLAAAPGTPARAQEDGSIAAAAALSAAYVESASTVLLARADDYADALAGAPLAAQLGTSILFVEGDVVSQEVLDELERLGAEEVVILGGQAAVSQAAEDQLRAEGYATRRIAGTNRFETAIQIAGALLGDATPDRLYFVEGEHTDPARGWPDAINAAAIAAAAGDVILPVNATRLPAEIAAYADTFPDAQRIIVGGPVAVTDPVATQIVGEDGEVNRLAGATRYQTSVETYDYGISEILLSSDVRFVIPGCSFVEGLAAGAIAGANRWGTVMVDCEDPGASPEALALLGNALDLVADTVLVGDAFAQAVVDAVAAATTPPEPEAAFCLRLLHHNDGESDVFPSDSGFGGLANMVTLAHQQQDAPLAPGCADGGVVTVTSGDNFLAGPELAASLALPADQPVYDALGLSLMNYDALALGNHDFDFNPDFTERFIESFTGEDPPPFLSANLDFSAEPGLQDLVDQGRIAPSVVVEVGSDQVGIIGLTTPALRTISSPRDVVVLQDIVAVTQAQVDALRDAGVDKIVLISHLQGLAGADGDLEFVPQISGIDVVVAGGGDEVLADHGDPLVPGHLAEVFGSYPLEVADAEGDLVPVVTTAGNYDYLGRLELRFDADGELLDSAPYDPARSRMLRVAEPHVPGGVEPNQTVVDQVYAPIQEFVADLETTVIAQSEVRLNGDRPAIRQSETNAGDLVADSQRWYTQQFGDDFGIDTSQPIVAIQNGGGIRHAGEDIGPGDITVLDTFSMVPFPNFVAAFEDFTAAELKQVLERAYFDVEGANGAFAQIAGMEVVVDLTQPAQVQDEAGDIVSAGERVRSVVLENGTPLVTDGEVVEGAPTVTLALVDFLARGGDGYPLDDDFTVLGASYQQALQAYITAPQADGGLEGLISAEQYPAGGAGRITILGLDG